MKGVGVVTKEVVEGVIGRGQGGGERDHGRGQWSRKVCAKIVVTVVEASVVPSTSSAETP